MSAKAPGYGFTGYAWTVFLCLLLVPFINAAFFTFPEGDDFASALRARHMFDLIGGIDQMFSAWWKWSGRYSYHFFSVFLGDVAEYRPLYSLFILVSFFITWLGVFGIAKELGRDKDSNQAVFTATLWLFVLLCTHGTVSQWYVLVEILTLIGGYSAVLLYLWSLCRLWNRPLATRGARWFCYLSCGAAVGFYEYGALLVLMISWGAYCLARLYGHPHRAIFFRLGIIASVCFLFCYLARGNFRRQTKRGLTSAIMADQLLHAGKDWWTYVVSAYCNPVFLAGAFIAGWFAPGWKTPLDRKIPAWMILGTGVALMLGFSAALTLVHAMSDITVGESPKLSANIVQYSAIPVLFALFACRDTLRLSAVRRLGRLPALLALILVLLAGQSNFFPVLWNGLLGEHARYEQAYLKRIAVMDGHQGEDLAVMQLLYAPAPLSLNVLKEQPKSWPNRYEAPFYGLKGLVGEDASSADAFAAAEERGSLAWKDAGPGIRIAYSPSVSLPGNDTRRFDWLFVEKDGGMPSVRIVVADKDSLPMRFVAALDTVVAGLTERFERGEWPFGRLFIRPEPREFVYEGRTLYAVPLTQSDSVLSGVGRYTFVSVNGNPFVPGVGE